MKMRLVFTAVAVLFVGALMATPASAQYVGGTPPDAGSVVNADTAGQGAATPVNVQAGRTARTSGVALTGADIAQLVLIGGVLIVGGAVLLRHGRRRVVPSAS